MSGEEKRDCQIVDHSSKTKKVRQSCSSARCFHPASETTFYDDVMQVVFSFFLPPFFFFASGLLNHPSIRALKLL
jgi:hypothetical protein